MRSFVKLKALSFRSIFVLEGDVATFFLMFIRLELGLTPAC